MLKNLSQIIKYYGIPFLVFRVYYALERKTGLQKKKFKIRPWNSFGLVDLIARDVQSFYASIGKFFFEKGQVPSVHGYKMLERADKVLQNRFLYFFKHEMDMGEKPDWFLNPLTGKRANPNVHWTAIQDLDPEFGDIKYVWEASRFAWTYELVRAFAATGDSKYVEKFWELFTDWYEANPPNQGIHYYCGQETSIRMMALCFAFFAFFEHPASTDENLEKLLKAIGTHAERVEKNIQYAISTRTNHALTESMGIYTVGLIFPQFKRAKIWKRKGKRIFERIALKQIFADGAYIQHSMNYHRLMLQTMIWAIRIAQLNHDRFSDALLRQVEKATDFLYQFQDIETGRVPNYGPNDGAVIMPLNSCDYLDYRPVIQAAHYLLTSKKLYTEGPWDEDLVWFFGEQAVSVDAAQKPQGNFAFPAGGYFSFRGASSHGLLRCHHYKTRPSHADALHLDIWFRGINVFRDSGSYLYNNSGSLEHFFSGTNAHNTISVDNLDQMTAGPRFIWFDWIQTGKVEYIERGNRVFFAGEHYGYRRLGGNIVHRRSVEFYKDLDLWIVTDHLTGTGYHDLQLNWQFGVNNFEFNSNFANLKVGESNLLLYTKTSVQAKYSILTGSLKEPAGFESLYYGSNHESAAMQITTGSDLPVKFVSVIAPSDKISISEAEQGLTIHDVDSQSIIKLIQL